MCLPGRRYLINWDSNIRSASEVKTHISKYEQLPYDGMLFDATFTHGQVSNAQRLSGWAFSDYRIDWPSLAASLSDAQTTPLRKFWHNFLMVKMTVVQPYAVADWYSSNINAVISNLRLAARYAKEASLAGIMLDMEPDNTIPGRKLLNYSDRPYASKYTFEEYKAKVESTTSEIARVLREEYEEMDLVLSFGYEQTTKQHNPPIETDNYGLLDACLKGFFKTAAAPTEIHNYYEDGYYHYSQAEADYDIAVMNKPEYNYPTIYRRGYASFIDGLGDVNLKAALTKSLSQISEKYCWTYKQGAPMMAADGSTGATPSTIKAIEEARVLAGIDDAFDPNIVPGLIADFNPDAMTFANGEKIEAYLDSIGNIYCQSGPLAQRPTFLTNGIAAGVNGVDFVAASNQNLAISGLVQRLVGSSDIPLTVIIVFKLKTLGTNCALLGFGRSATTNAEITFHQASANVLRWSIADNAGGNATVTGAGINTDANPHIGAWIYSGKVLNMLQDGSNVINTNPYITADYNAITLDQARLGSNARNTIGFFADVITGRVLVYNQPLSLETVRWLKQGLNKKLGIALAGA